MDSDRDPLCEQIASLKKSFFDEGNLDEQFVAIEKLQDGFDPHFHEEVVTLFFKDSVHLLATVDRAFENPDFDFLLLEKTLHRYKGSASSIGACKLVMEGNKVREYLKEKDIEKAKSTFQNLKEEHDALKKKLETYFLMARQLTPEERSEVVLLENADK